MLRRPCFADASESYVGFAYTIFRQAETALEHPGTGARLLQK